MKRIDVSTPKFPNTFAFVDDSDFDRINAFNWHAYQSRSDKRIYASRALKLPDGRRAKKFMHREILDTPLSVDHRDLDGLNNTRANLRPATHSQNCQNTRKPKHGVTSQYKGVSWNKGAQKYQATVRTQKKNHYLGLFKNEADAGWAYDREARNLFGSFARCNFPPPPAIPLNIYFGVN